MKSPFLTSLSFASEQGAKLNMGRCTFAIYEYGNYNIVTFFSHKVTTTIVSTCDSNIGSIIDLRELLSPLIEIFSNMIE